MNLNLKNKKALVTGSSHGIGLEIAKCLSREGCVVAINGRNNKKLLRASKLVSGSFPIQGDVTNYKIAKKVINNAIKNLGRIDILICNVGSGKSKKTGEESYNEWERVFKKNFWSVVNIVKESQKFLIKSKGNIVCISSICGLEFIPGAPVTYSTAKSALNTYIKSMSYFFGKYGVRINGIAPGNILFKNSIWEKKLKNQANETRKFLNKNIPLKKFGSTHNVADLTTYLASKKSEFITGSIFVVDGGQTRKI